MRYSICLRKRLPWTRINSLCSRSGVLDEKQQLRPTLNAEEAERLIKEYSDGDERKDSLAPGLSAALRAYRQEVPRSNLISYDEDGIAA